MPRDFRSAVAEAPAGTEGQRPCSRGQWCASRTVTITDGERVIAPALGYRAFCDHDWELIGTCTGDLPAIWLRLAAELHQPAAAETRVHVPFGPSIPVRLDVDAAMRLTAMRLAMWEARVRSASGWTARNPFDPVISSGSVAKAAGTLVNRLSVLLALQSAPATRNFPLHPGRHGQPASVSPEVLEDYADAEIIRVGADFIGLWVAHNGADAGLELLHLHYWDRAVLRETPARPEELIGVECRSKDCSALALRRAEPAWYSGDPEYYSECASCGDLMTEDDYRMWVNQLAAYHRARIAAMPVLGGVPSA